MATLSKNGHSGSWADGVSWGNKAPSKFGRPIKAIQKDCVACSGDKPQEVKHCTAADCPLWSYRFGIKPATAAGRGRPVDIETAPQSPLKAIRLRCLGCGEGSAQVVDRCEIPECRLYPFRFGVRPETAAKRGKQIEQVSQ